MVDLRGYGKILEQGRAAGRDGKKADTCPYRNKPSARREHDAWMAGFNEGSAERKARAAR